MGKAGWEARLLDLIVDSRDVNDWIHACAAVEQAGFRCAFMNAGGGFGAKIAGAKINRFALPRVHVTAEMSLAEFEAHISGFYRSLRKRLIGGDELEAVVGA